MALTIMGVLAFILVPRASLQGFAARVNACHVNTGNIETQAQLWFRNKGTWPATSLSDIGGNVTYFPDGLEVCPVDGSSYTFSSSTQAVVGHTH